MNSLTFSNTWQKSAQTAGEFAAALEFERSFTKASASWISSNRRRSAERFQIEPGYSFGSSLLVDLQNSVGPDLGLVDHEGIVEQNQSLGRHVRRHAPAHRRERDRIIESDEQG